ncbi:hypothetical protein, partial [Escherichia coli]|uniref:hypothetical protein n=1 Tax=Escherichia coli TaxID=562 RepID=UPI00358DCC22
MLLTSIKNVEINHVLSKTWKFILTAVPGGFFIQFLHGSLLRAFFISSPCSAYVKSEYTTQKVSAGAFDRVLFLWAAGGPF